MKKLLLKFYPTLVLGIIYSIFLKSILKPDVVLNIYPDNESLLGAILSFASKSIQKGEFPFWMNSVLGGIPLYNSPQLSAYYPFYFLYLNVFETPLDTIFTLHKITLFHIALLMLSTYFLLRTLRISKEASFIGVVFIVFNLSTLELTKWVHLIASYSWLPLYLAGLIRILETPFKRSNSLIIVFSFLMIVSAMVGQPLILALIFTVFIVLGFVITYKSDVGNKNTFLRVLYLGIVLIISICLGAPIIFPVVMEIGEMIRWVSSDQAIIGNLPIPFDKFLTDQLSISEIPTFFFKIGITHDISNPYIGLFPIFFAIIAIKERSRHWIVFPLLVLALYSFFSSFGNNFGFAYFNYYLPVVNKIREPSYFLLPLNISIGILAAMGIDNLFNSENFLSNNKRLVFGFVACAMLVIFLFILLFGQLTLNPEFLTNVDKINKYILISTAFFFALLLVCFLINKKMSIRKTKLGLFIIVLLLIGSQVVFVRWNGPRISQSDYMRFNMVALENALSRVAELDPNREYRVVFGGDINSQTAAMLASYQGVRTLNSYFNPMPFNQYLEMYYNGGTTSNYYRGLGAKFLICRQCNANDITGYVMAETISGYSIYIANESFPHIYTSNNILGEYVNLNDYVLKVSLSSLAENPVFLDPIMPMSNSPIVKKDLTCSNRITHKSLNNLAFIVNCNEPAMLVLNEFFTDSWTATVNRNVVTLLKVNGNQIGIPLDSGSHLVEFEYYPINFKHSLWFFAFGILALIIILFGKHYLNI